jgi:hypothetical protein
LADIPPARKASRWRVRDARNTQTCVVCRATLTAAATSPAAWPGSRVQMAAATGRLGLKHDEN